MEELDAACGEAAQARPEDLPGLQRLVDGVAKGNAAAAVPNMLAALKGAARGHFASLVVKKLGRSWHCQRSS